MLSSAASSTFSAHVPLASASVRAAGAPAPRVLMAAGAAALLRHRQQPARGFRFGWWAGAADREPHREMRQRHRALRNKLLWAQQPQHAGAADMMPRPSRRAAAAVHHHWQPKRCFAFSRYCASKDDFFKAPGPQVRAHPGPRIEDVERSDWGPFLFRDSDGKQTSWASSFDDLRSYIAKRQAAFLDNASFGSPSSSVSASASAPSSGRVSASASSPPGPVPIPASVAASLSTESDFVIDPITNRKVSKSSAKSTPDESVDVPAALVGADLDGPASFDGPLAPLQAPALDADLPPTPGELRAYKNVTIDDISVNEVGTPVADSVPFGGLTQASQQPKYDDLGKYKPIHYNEPDGKLPEAEPSFSLDELKKYKPVTWNEPDGQPTPASTAFARTTEDEQKPFKGSEPEPQEPQPTAAAATVETAESPYDPEELAKYKPFHWNEPDGQPTTPPVEIGHAGYNPVEVQKYQAFMWNEPDGKPNDPVELGHHGYDQAEVQQYGAFRYHEPDGKVPDANEEVGHHGYDQAEVQQYKAFRYNEPDGKPAVVTGEIGHEGYDQAEVQQYKAYRYNEPDGKPPVETGEVGHHGYDQVEVQQYKAFRYNEPDGKPAVVAGEIGHEGYDQVEVQQYKAFRYNEPDGKAPGATDGVTAASELGSYNAVRYQEPDGQAEAVADATAESLKAYDNATPSSSPVSATHFSALDASAAQVDAEHDAVDQLASASVKAYKSRTRRQLSDAERARLHVDPYSTEPQGLETAFAREAEASAGKPIFARVHKRVERAETADAAKAAGTTEAAERFVYKILAYDPTMQTINVAETASTVADTAVPLTPAEVLPRLSNATKFFPHFQPLQAEGFEIVSGSGDVLVFRKVREADSNGNGNGNGSGNGNSNIVGPSTASAASPAINPIDMTGKAGYVPPSTANFVSPTGYVNLDLPPLPTGSSDASASGSTATASASPRSVKVQREEAVFSGPKETGAETKAASVAKRMVVGATWVAGVSYALGVASEYMKGR